MKTLEMPYEAEEEKNSEYIGVEKEICERCGVSCKNVQQICTTGKRKWVGPS